MKDQSLSAIRESLRAMLPDLSSRYGVSSLSIFGSRVRGEERAESDLDLLVEFAQSGLTLWDFIGLEQEIGDRLGLKVDLVDRKALRPELQPFVLPEALPV